MAKFSWDQTLVWVSLAGALVGCSTLPDSQEPVTKPPLAMQANPAPRDPVLQSEPPSRTGNPESYVVFGRRYQVRETSEGYRERGIASWYGWDFHDRKTSSGSLYNMFELTAAHKSLPLPSYVQVTNLGNGRTVVVKVNDRGPFVGKRIIDLSYAAADRLGMLGQGTASVEVVALAPYQFLPTLAARRAEARERLASRRLRTAPTRAVQTALTVARQTRLISSQQSRTSSVSKPALRLALAAKPSQKAQGPTRPIAALRVAAAEPEARRIEERRAVVPKANNAQRGPLAPAKVRPAPSNERPVERPSRPTRRNFRADSGLGGLSGLPVAVRDSGSARLGLRRLASLKMNRTGALSD